LVLGNARASDLELSAISDLYRHRGLAGLGSLGLHCLDNVEAVDNTTEHDVLSVEPASFILM
jgi:hypothetical protein